MCKTCIRVLKNLCSMLTMNNRPLLSDALFHMIAAEYEKDSASFAWTQLITVAIGQVTQKETNRINAGLIGLRSFFKAFTLFSDSAKQFMEDSVAHVFPTLTNLFPLLFSQQCVEFIELRSHVCKILFYVVRRLNIPKFLTSIQIFDTWIHMLQQCLIAPVPKGTSAESVHWKPKKWVLRTLLRIFFLSNSSIVVKSHAPHAVSVAAHFAKQYAEPMVQLFIQMLAQKVDQKVVTARLFGLLNMASESKQLFERVMRPNLQSLIAQVIFPHLYFNSEDASMWQHNPQEYLLVSFDIPEQVDDDQYTKISACGFLHSLLSDYHQEVIPVFMAALQAGFNTYAQNPQNFVYLKEACMYVLGNCSDVIRRDKVFKHQLEDILVKHVFPDFTSTFGSLRAKSCWILGKFAKIQWKQFASFLNGVQGVIKCLEDPQVPVQVKAATCIGSIATIGECKPLLLPVLPKLMQVYLKMMNEMELEDVVVGIEILMDTYPEQMHHYALTLCSGMVDSCQPFLSSLSAPIDSSSTQLDDDDDQESDTENLIPFYLRALVTLLSVLNKDTHCTLLAQLETKLTPLVHTLLHPLCNEHMIAGFQILYYLTRFIPQNIPLSVWSLFPILCTTALSHGKEDICSIVPVLFNYLAREGIKVFTNRDLCQLLTRIIVEHIAENEDISQLAYVQRLMAAMLVFGKGQLDVATCLTPILQSLCKQMQNKEAGAKSFIIANCFSQCISYNPLLIVQILQNNAGPALYQWTNMLALIDQSKIVTEMLDSELPVEYEMKVALIGFTSLMSCNIQQAPAVVQQAMPIMCTQAIKLLIKVVEIKKKKQQARSSQIDKDDEDLLSDGFKRTQAIMQKLDACAVYQGTDELVCFAQAIAVLITQQPSIVASILSQFPKQEQEIVQSVMAITATLQK